MTPRNAKFSQARAYFKGFLNKIAFSVVCDTSPGNTGVASRPATRALTSGDHLRASQARHNSLTVRPRTERTLQMSPTPKNNEQKIERMLNAWQTLAPDKSFGGDDAHTVSSSGSARPGRTPTHRRSRRPTHIGHSRTRLGGRSLPRQSPTRRQRRARRPHGRSRQRPLRSDGLHAQERTQVGPHAQT
jgi:hypothetical protein